MSVTLFPGLTATVEIGWTSNPLTANASVSWTDVTSRVRSITTLTRGKSNELDTVQPGSMSIVFDNRDRALDPLYAAGTYYPNVIPRRRIRVTVGGSVRFHGHILGFPQQYTNPSDATVTCNCVDGMSILARTNGPSHAFDLIVGAETTATEKVWYGFDEATGQAAIDRTTNSNDGEYAGQPLWATNTVAGQLINSPSPALKMFPYVTSDFFAAGGGYGFGLTSNNPDLLPHSFPWTMEVWVRTPPSVGGTSCNAAFLYFNGLTGAGSISVDPKNQQIGAYHESASYQRIVSGTALPDTLYHVVAVWNNTTTAPTLYINGVLQTGTTSGSGTGTAPAASDFVQVVINGDQATDYLIVDEFLLWTGALTAAAVLDHYNAGANGLNGELTSTRIGRLLDFAGLATADRALDTGYSTMGPVTSLASIADGIAEAVATEQGNFLFDTANVATFKYRHSVYGSTRSRTAQATFNDDGTGVGYQAIRPDYDDSLIRNIISVPKTAGPNVRLRDATSIAAYGPIMETLNLPSSLTDAQRLDAAALRLRQYKNPILRVNEIRCNVAAVGGNPTWQATLTGLQFLDRVRVVRRPPAGGAAIDQQLILYGYSETITPASWDITLYTSPIGTVESPFILGDSPQGQLGVNSLGT